MPNHADVFADILAARAMRAASAPARHATAAVFLAFFALHDHRDRSQTACAKIDAARFAQWSRYRTREELDASAAGTKRNHVVPAVL